MSRRVLPLYLRTIHATQNSTSLRSSPPDLPSLFKVNLVTRHLRVEQMLIGQLESKLFGPCPLHDFLPFSLSSSLSFSCSDCAPRLCE